MPYNVVYTASDKLLTREGNRQDYVVDHDLRAVFIDRQIDPLRRRLARYRAAVLCRALRELPSGSESLVPLPVVPVNEPDEADWPLAPGA